MTDNEHVGSLMTEMLAIRLFEHDREKLVGFFWSELTTEQRNHYRCMAAGGTPLYGTEMP